jgi:hypothetical protein
MSQTGVIISCGGAPQEYGNLNWVVDFTYQLDSGVVGQSRALVGNAANRSNFTGPTATLWTSPQATVTLSPNPPGTTNPVILACPPLVQCAAYGLPLK